jgi:hypothetical protein
METAWPATLTEFIRKHTKKEQGVCLACSRPVMPWRRVSKRICRQTTSKYLGQDITHMWLTTAFGHPVRNLLADR